MTGPPANEAAARAFNARKLALADQVRHDGRLSASTRLIGAEICSLTNVKTGYSWASVEFLAEKLTVTDRTIKRAIVALREAGYITIEKVGRNNRYRPVFEALEKGTNCPLSETEQGTICPPSDAERGQERPEQGTILPENRGQKSPPISLEISLGISARAEAGVGGAPGGAARAGNFDLGLPGVLLRKRIGDAKFASWLGKVAFVSLEDGELTLSAPTRSAASYIATNFTEVILECWRLERGGVDRLRMTVVEQVTPLRPRREDPDARWLVDQGVAIVADRLRCTRASADKTLIGWLKRCGRDVAGLRRIIEEAADQELVEEQFGNVIKQRTRALLQADQPALRLPPVPLKRRAS